jgi:hypothetical protein
VDPWPKVAAGIAEGDLNYMWDALLQKMIGIAALEEDNLATASALDVNGSPEEIDAHNNHCADNIFQ